MALINVTNLTFAYEGSYDTIFENAGFQLDTAWKLGFVGRNGRGKTTFLRLLMGQYTYGGSITAPVEFVYFPFEVATPGDLTGDIAREIAACEEWALRREVNLMGMDEDILYRPFDTLSPGEQTRVLLAALFLKDDRFLLIDEPTNHLDLQGRRIVREYLNRKKGFILVSHDRAFLDGCVDHILCINRATIEVQRGNYSSWAKNKAQRDAWEMAENKRLGREIDHLREAERRAGRWADKIEAGKLGAADRGYVGAQAARMMTRAKAIEKRRQKAADEKEGLLKNVETAQPLKLSPLTHRADLLAQARDLTIRYGPYTACQDVSFQIKQGERLALVGGNGSGKSSIIKLIVGQGLAHSGTLRLATGLICSYVPQDTRALRGDLRAYARLEGIDESLFKTILRKLDFPRVQLEKDMENYSAGQRKKVLLARSLCQSAHLYVWDEPLNYVDILSREQLEELILAYRPTMLFVEHDEAFLQNVATGRVELG